MTSDNETTPNITSSEVRFYEVLQGPHQRPEDDGEIHAVIARMSFDDGESIVEDTLLFPDFQEAYNFTQNMKRLPELTTKKVKELEDDVNETLRVLVKYQEMVDSGTYYFFYPLGLLKDALPNEDIDEGVEEDNDLSPNRTIN